MMAGSASLTQCMWDPCEQKAREHGLHYVHLQGSVGVIGNGAGLVMSSLDAVSGAGEDQGTNVKPANFLDIGGGASAEVMCGSLEIVLSDPQVESVLINVYGGITSASKLPRAFWKPLTSFWQFQASGSPFSTATRRQKVCIFWLRPIVSICMLRRPWKKPAQQAARLAANGKEVR